MQAGSTRLARFAKEVALMKRIVLVAAVAALLLVLTVVLIRQVRLLLPTKRQIGLDNPKGVVFWRWIGREGIRSSSGK
jgi:hypothetical protein